MATEIDWIIDGLKKPGKSQRGLARALGTDASVVNRIVQGTRQLKAAEISPIAAYLGVPVPRGDFRSISLSDAWLSVAGVVELGSFREIASVPLPQSKQVAVAFDKRYPKCRQSAYEVRGDGAADIGITSGMYVAAANYEDYRKFHGPLSEGHPVIIETKINIGSGEIAEWSIRTVRFEGANAILEPKSITIPRVKLEAGTGDTKVIGVVIGATRLF
jgi:transcriptional regulator with XRE-family HTH domain